MKVWHIGKQEGIKSLTQSEDTPPIAGFMAFKTRASFSFSWPTTAVKGKVDMKGFFVLVY